MSSTTDAPTPPMAEVHRNATIGSQLLTSCVRFAEQLAIADGRVRWTYGDLADQIARMISALKAAGLKRGQSLCVLAGNRAEVLAATSAAALMGLRTTPLHPLAAEDEHAYVLKDADIDALVVDPEQFGDRARRLKARTLGLQHLMSLGPLEGATDLLLEMARAKPAPLIDEAHSNDLAAIGYTGGTTGRSKGAMFSHRMMTMSTLLMAADWDWPQEIRLLAASPISHAAGMITRPVILRGGSVHLLSRFEPERFMECIQRDGITCTFLVPTMLYALLDHPARDRFDLSSLETIIYGASPISPDRLAQAIDVFGPVFMQLYGQTEAPNCITALRKVDHRLDKPHRLMSCGLPCPGMDVRILDPDLNELGPGEPGEICVRGPLVMEGYWKQPEATVEAFRGGWLHTGDVAVRDQDGYLTIIDRIKDMIISGGFNIYPREVEDALMSHPDVTGAAVIGVPDPKWGEATTAFVTLQPGVVANVDAMMAHVRALKGAPWTPKAIHIVDAIPLTALGKPDRKALRARFWSASERQVS